MPAIGWLTNGLTDANKYFLEQRLISTAWDALTAVSGSKDEKTAVLNMAYNRIRFCKDFSIPASPSTTQLEKLQHAQLECAYYLAVHLRDEDVRMGIQAQGVTSAGIVNESYVDLNTLPLPPIVYQLLDEFSTSGDELYISMIDRDEDDDDMTI